MYDGRPPYNNIPFTFGASGYSPPDFNDVNFTFSSKTSNLKAAIVGSELQRDYLKYCETYVLGYSAANVQILKHSCTYGGIRDLNAYMGVVAHFLDLGNYIRHSFPGHRDLNKNIRGWGKQEYDLQALLKGWVREVPIDLPVYLKQTTQDSKDLPEYVNIFQSTQTNLREILKGWKREVPFDFFKIIKGIVRTYTDFPGYLKPTKPGHLDLVGDIFKIWQHNNTDLNKLIHGWQELDLNKTIRAFHYRDLPVSVITTYLSDLAAHLQAVSPVDLSGNIMSWALYNLQLKLTADTYRPDFLPASIYGVAPKDLAASIQTRKEIEKAFDLGVTIERFPRFDLQYLINAIAPKDLPAYLNARGYVSDLQCFIYPKVVFVKTLMNVSYLENMDLKASINFPCFNSGYRDLNYTLYSMHSVGLKAILFGTDGSNIRNLRILINASDYITQNKIDVSCFNQVQHNTKIDALCNRQQPTYYMDKLEAVSGTGPYSNINMSIIGDYLTSDLAVGIVPYINPHYLEPNVKHNVLVLKFNNNREDWRRYVELSFNNYIRSYYYFSGNQKAYKEFKDEHWEIRVQGYSLANLPEGIDRAKVRTKYIFNLKNYASIDAAIRDMIDRVSDFRQSDLSGTIFGVV